MDDDVDIVLWIIQHAYFQGESVGTGTDKHVKVLSLADYDVRSTVRMEDVSDADAVTMRRPTDYGSRGLPTHRRATYERKLGDAS